MMQSTRRYVKRIKWRLNTEPPLHEKSQELLLCATSVSSVPLWLGNRSVQQPQRHRGHRGCTAKERGEVVLARCLQDCEENSVEGDVESGRALQLPKPRYPALARAAHASGQVTVQLLIDVDGTVMDAAAVSGHPLLYGVSVEAARNSRFSPTKLDGKPVKVTGVITYNFLSQ